MLAGVLYFQESMVVREANNCFLIFEKLIFHDCVSSMTLFCSGFEHLESGWIFCMYPARRHLSNVESEF